MFRKLLDFMSEDKLFKFVYDSPNSYSYSRNENTLLISAKSVTDAVKKFHEMTDSKVRHISEVVELTYPPVSVPESVDVKESESN